MSIEEKAQGLVNSLTQGVAVKVLRIIVFAILVLGVFGIYRFSRFRGLREPAAMEAAQLARRLAEGEGFRTFCIRPADLWMLRDGAITDGYPDIRQAPLYPLVLSWCFRTIRPDFESKAGTRIFEPERRVVAPLGILFSAATVGLIFLTAMSLFNRPVALASSLIFLTTHSVLSDSISGTALPLTALLATAAVWSAVTAVRNKKKERHPLLWLTPLLLSGLTAGLAFLTGYRMFVVVPVVAVFVGLSGGRGGWTAAAAAALIALVVAAPWLIRNRAVSGHILGIAPYTCLNDSVLYEDQGFDRTTTPDVRVIRTVPAMKLKIASNLGRLYDLDLRTIGSGLAICLFLVSFFVPREDRVVQALGWCVGAGLLMLIVLCALSGSGDALRSLLPAVVICGVGFAFELVAEKTAWPDAFWQPLLTGWLVVLTAAPAMLIISGTRASIPYPPYFPPFAEYVCGLTEPGETICTDIPWATAWYGNRRSLLLPRNTGELLEINTNRFPLAGIYLTTATGDKPYTRSLADGAESSWLPLLERRVPEGFPFRQGIDIPPGSRDQLFITDKVRW